MRELLLPCNITAGYFDRRIVLIAVYFGSSVQLRYQGGLYLQYSGDLALHFTEPSLDHLYSLRPALAPGSPASDGAAA